jgi:ATP-dependent protease ClpP protease subunit
LSVRAVPKQWYRIEQNAIGDAADIYIFDEISPWGVTASDFVAELDGIRAASINVHVNSPGGDVYDGIAIFNSLRNHPATVTAYIPGIAASIATVIAMGADRIVIAPHAKMMIHEAWAMSAGNASDFAKMAERLEATSENIAAIYSERAGQDTAYWRDLMRAETWYTDKQAVEAGLADEVGRSNDQNALRQAAAFDLSIFRYGEQEAARLREEASVAAPEEAPEPVDEPVEEPVTEETTEEPEVETPPAAESWIVVEARRLADEKAEMDAALAAVKL